MTYIVPDIGVDGKVVGYFKFISFKVDSLNERRRVTAPDGLWTSFQSFLLQGVKNGSFFDFFDEQTPVFYKLTDENE